MMNKNKSARTNLLRFLFMLPVLAVVLVSFRKQIGNTFSGKKSNSIVLSAKDTIREELIVNKQGYAITVKHKEGQNYVIVRDAKGVEVKRMLLSEWDKDAKKNESIYGEVPPPPPPLPATGILVEVPLGIDPSTPPAPPVPPAPVKLPASIQKITIENDNATVVLKNGQTEKYNLNNDAEKAKFDIKYGEFVPPPPPPPPPPAKYSEKPIGVIQFKGNVEITDASLNGPANPNEAKGAFVKGVPDNVIFILDGIEITKEKLNELEPGTIESIDVLKGNTAEAAYGHKGRNGVIIIKTKKKEAVKPNQPKISNLFLISKDDGC